MRNETRSALFMMAACIGPSDPWVLTVGTGAVRLAPLRLMSLREQRSVPAAGVLLDLTDLGCIGADCTKGLAEPSTSPLRNRPEVVLLFPWSLVSTVTELEELARTAPYQYEPRFAPEDWLATWHHFLDADEWPPAPLVKSMAPQARVVSPVLSAQRRHVVLAAVRQAQGADIPSGRASRDDQVLAAVGTTWVDSLNLAHAESAPSAAR